MRLVLILILLPLPVFAQDWIDYGQLLRDNAGRIEITTDANGAPVQRIDFGDGVVVDCTAEGCAGTDSQGALGCSFAILVDLSSLQSTCPDSLDPEASARLKTGFDRLGAFVEANAVPPREAGYAQGLLDAAIGRRAGVSEEERLATCKRLVPGPEGDLAEFLAYVSGAEFLAAMEEQLSTPRLPVMNPCL